MNIIKYGLLCYFLVFSNLHAEIIRESIGEENLKTVTKYLLENNKEIFLYKYSYSINPHVMTVLIAKNCDCERSLQFDIDDESGLMSYDNKTGEYSSLEAKGFLGMLYSGAGEIYKKITIEDGGVKFNILITDIYQYREPNVKLIKADLLKFKWGKKGDKYQILEKNKEIIIVDDLSEDEENSPPKKTIAPTLDKDNSKNKTESINSGSGSLSLGFLSIMLGLLAWRLN